MNYKPQPYWETWLSPDITLLHATFLRKTTRTGLSSHLSTKSIYKDPQPDLHPWQELFSSYNDKWVAPLRAYSYHPPRGGILLTLDEWRMKRDEEPWILPTMTKPILYLSDWVKLTRCHKRKNSLTGFKILGPKDKIRVIKLMLVS